MAITSTAPVISSTGISAPTFEQVLDFLVAKYQGIFGSDVYLGPDSQDFQKLANEARCISDTNAAIIATYNAYSPATAQGAGLSSVVKINGLSRAVPTFSTVDLTLTGTVGVTISNGVVTDQSNNRWDLPTSVTIPAAGTITVTATCESEGAINISAGATWTINTPTLGWSGCTNANASAPGNPVELDPALRNRQASSVALPSLSILDGIAGALEAIPGVTRLQVYENPTGSTTSSGLPPFSLTCVVEGGDDQVIANTIALKKGVGVDTHGTTSAVVTTPYSNPTIYFFRPIQTVATIAIRVTPLSRYTTTIGAAIATAVVTYVNSLPIGKNLQLTKLYLPANLYGAADSATYEITSLTINGGSSDLTVDFANVAYVDPTSGVTVSTS